MYMCHTGSHHYIFAVNFGHFQHPTVLVNNPINVCMTAHDVWQVAPRLAHSMLHLQISIL